MSGTHDLNQHQPLAAMLYVESGGLVAHLHGTPMLSRQVFYEADSHASLNLFPDWQLPVVTLAAEEFCLR